jgi:hypothetical protein
MILAVISCAAVASSRGDEPAERLGMTRPVVCRDVHGYADYDERPGAALTADEKLTIYYEPTGQVYEKLAKGYRNVLSQDGRLRKKGSKEVIWKKEPMFEYEAKFEVAPFRLYMRSDVNIKGLPAGDYEFDVTLRDKLSKEKDAKVTRTVEFKVVPPKEKPAPPVPDGRG